MSINLSHHVGRPGLLSFLLAAVPLSAQCQFAWQPGTEAPSPTGTVRAILPTANGDLYVGGGLLGAGSTLFQNIGRYDGAQWHPLGAGIDGFVDDLIQLPNGDIVACGIFDTAGNAVANNIARWDGLDWYPLGSGCDDLVRDMAVLPGGGLVAVGIFTAAGGVNVEGVAVWDGVSWSALGAGLPAFGASAVTVRPNGDIVVCGSAQPGSPDVQIWDGTSWSGLNGVGPNELSLVDNVHALPSGEVVIDGWALVTSSWFNLSIWDGTTVQPLVSPFTTIHDLATAPNGDLLVAGTSGSQPAAPVARYDGSSWTLIGNSLESGFNLLEVTPGGSLIVAREGLNSSVSNSDRIAELQFSQWVHIASAPWVLGSVLAAAPEGDVYAGGTYSVIEGVAANNIARRGPQGWVAMGQGVDGNVSHIAVAPDGSVIVGGSFQTAGGIPANHVARWSGSSWSTLGAGFPFATQALGVNESGTVLAAAGNVVYLFDGQVWSSVGNLLGTTRDVVVLDNGDFLMAGNYIDFTPTPSTRGMARVSNGQLTFESAFDGKTVNCMVADGSGGVYVGGIGAPVEQYDGTTLSVVASTSQLGNVRDLQVAPNGDLIASAGETGNRTLHRWDGSVWTQIVGSPTASVLDMVLGARGEIYVAGAFYTAGGVVSSGIARAETTCPADAVTFGAGCVGSAGTVELEAIDMPWIGTTMDQVATGMAPGSLALHLIGTQTGVVPLPFGAPGCSLIVAPIFSDALVPQGGDVSAPLTIPAQAALVGQDLFTQVVGLELGAGLTLLQTTGSNALQLTIGAF